MERWLRIDSWMDKENNVYINNGIVVLSIEVCILLWLELLKLTLEEVLTTQ